MRKQLLAGGFFRSNRTAFQGFISGNHCGLHHFCAVSGFYLVVSRRFKTYASTLTDFLHLGRVNVFKLYQNTQEALVQESKCVFADAGRNTIIGFRNTAGDGCNGIAVAADGNGISNGILKRGRFKKCLQCLRHTALAGDIKGIFITNISQSEIHGIVVCIDIIPDLHHAVTGSGHVNCNSGSLGTFQTFGVIMGDGGYQMGQFLDCINAIGSITTAAYAHGGTVAVTVVRLGIIVIHPMKEMTTITAAGVRSANLLHTDDCLLGQIAVIGFTAHQCFTDGQ